jgi:hypothetical protein
VSDRLVSTTDSIALDTPTPETALGGDENLDNTPLGSSLTPLEDLTGTNTLDTPALAVGGGSYTIAELVIKLGKTRQSIEGRRKRGTLHELGYRAEQLNSKWFYYSI